jgi:hypothetical protein
MTPTHPSLAAPLAMSAGDLSMAPPPELFSADDSAPGTTVAGGVGARGAGGADALGVGGANAMDSGGTADVGTEWERRYPFIGYARSDGAGC